MAAKMGSGTWLKHTRNKLQPIVIPETHNRFAPLPSHVTSRCFSELPVWWDMLVPWKCFSCYDKYIMTSDSSLKLCHLGDKSGTHEVRKSLEIWSDNGKVIR